jgi:hypothetical protein
VTIDGLNSDNAAAEGLWKKPGRGKRGKPKSRFSSLPTALGNPAKPAGFPLFPQPRLLLVSLKQHREI